MKQLSVSMRDEIPFARLPFSETLAEVRHFRFIATDPVFDAEQSAPAMRAHQWLFHIPT
jgi:hypothetical protein